MYRIHKQVRSWPRFRENLFGELVHDIKFKKPDADVQKRYQYLMDYEESDEEGAI